MSGPLESSITLEEVFAVVSAKRVPLAPELAGYLALEIAEGAGGAPGEVDPRQVYIGDEGTVALVFRQKRSDATNDKAEESIRSLLQRLLEASGSQTPALDAAAKKEAGAGIASLAQELEAALVPVNRAAGRRALARLAREVKRVTLGVGRNASIPPDAQQRRSIRGSQPSYPGHTGPRSQDGRRSRPRDEVDSLLSAFEVEGPRSDAVVSRDLKEIAGLTPTPPPLQPASVPLPVSAAGPASARTPAGAFPTSTREPVSSARVPAPAPAPLSSRGQALTPPGQGQKRQAPFARRIGLVVAAVAVLAVGAAILAWILRSGSRTPPALPAEKAALEPAPSARPPRPCKATVIITDALPRAELLVRAGQTPLEVPRMPVGARLEFVATGDGFAPKRAVIPKNAPWDAGSGKPRYEMTIELEKARAKSGVDPWPPGEPGSEVGGHGAPGTVHIVSTPRSAEIWLLAGLGPEAIIDQLACDSDVDILVAGPSTYRKRLHIGQNEFVEVSPPGGEVARKARVSAK
ncbi:hypothetical protein LZC95_15575 [Pendulispora brunnea]|uniref:Uncharacterized protein n=1 Tax=Pendulispora brunnea TaxID=2905690 RepID=A0ABZ2KI64_9BACT